MIVDRTNGFTVPCVFWSFEDGISESCPICRMRHKDRSDLQPLTMSVSIWKDSQHVPSAAGLYSPQLAVHNLFLGCSVFMSRVAWLTTGEGNRPNSWLRPPLCPRIKMVFHKFCSSVSTKKYLSKVKSNANKSSPAQGQSFIKIAPLLENDEQTLQVASSLLRPTLCPHVRPLSLSSSHFICNRYTNNIVLSKRRSSHTNIPVSASQ